MKKLAVIIRIAVALLYLLPCLSPAADRPSAPVNIFAAASLKTALDEATAAWQKQSGNQAVATYAGSNALAKQIEQGAPADLFVSADRLWMRALSDKGLTVKDSERDWLGNRLVLIAPKDSRTKLRIAPGFALAAALGDGHLAMCNPSVPAGEYGTAALQTLGVWADLRSHVAQTDNVRAALALVARGEASFGIVYSTDANAEPGVRLVDTFPEDTHPPIVYPIARIKGSTNPAAPLLLDYLESAEARPYFEKQGFVVLGH